MSILPSGSRKVLHAQTEPTYDMGLGGDLPTDGQLRDFATTPYGHEDVQRASDNQELTNEFLPSEVNKSKDDSDILQWVMRLMYDLGYQINEDLAKYANEFVKENIFTGPDGQLGERRVVLTIPDRYGRAYGGGFMSDSGVKKRLSNGIITDIIAELKDKFGLYPIPGAGKEGAPIAREDGKLIINLSSNRPQPAVEEEDIEEPTSELDELFGSGSGEPPTKRKKTNAKSASTFENMMRKAKNEVFANWWDKPGRGYRPDDEIFRKRKDTAPQYLVDVFRELEKELSEKHGLRYKNFITPQYQSERTVTRWIDTIKNKLKELENKPVQEMVQEPVKEQAQEPEQGK